MGDVVPGSSAGSIPTPRTYRKGETGRIVETAKTEEKPRGFSPGCRQMGKLPPSPAMGLPSG